MNASCHTNPPRPLASGHANPRTDYVTHIDLPPARLADLLAGRGQPFLPLEGFAALEMRPSGQDASESATMADEMPLRGF